MLERMNELPKGVEGVRASGKVTAEDYERTLRPLLEDARRDGRRVRFLYEIAADFEGFTAGAAWDDARIGIRYMQRFAACAVVTDIGWMREATRFAGAFMPCPMRAFTNAERENAISWLASSGERSISYVLQPESGVVLVELKSALRAEDFDALSATVDSWLEAHVELRGIVIHAHEFPGWENFAALAHHIRFVRDHQREIHRIAISADGVVANLAPRLAEHFVKAEIKHFDYDALNEALAWAKA
ncbi:MAG: STAS/SEC14 domain-containing protein [Polyangiaceae bacterium]